MYRRLAGLALLPALLLCPPTMLRAQPPEWKRIVCTIDTPDNLRGLVMPISFSENGSINYDGIQSSGAVTATAIRFCYASPNSKQSCLAISRVSGRFTLTIPLGYALGSCVAAENPKPG
jgi:hypothetical protein